MACGIMVVFSFGTLVILMIFVFEQFPIWLRAMGVVCVSVSISLGFALYRDWETDRKSTRLNSSHEIPSRMPSSA